MKCDIIIPVWNQYDFTKKCVESIFKNTKYAFHLIIIDNASSFPTRDYLDEIAGANKETVTLLRNDKNLGFIKAVNRGINQSAAPYICLLNNDTKVTKGWLEEMIKVAEKDRNIGIVNANSNTLGCRVKPGQSIESLAESLKVFSGDHTDLAWATGFCMLIKREVIDKIGLFDEAYGMGNFEDADFSKRARDMGYFSVCAKASYVYHRERRSFIRLKRFSGDFDRNREMFYSKWGKLERILYVLKKDDVAYRKKTNRNSMNLARDGNIVWIFLRRPGREGLTRHSNIYVYNLPVIFFDMVSLWRILKRSKKFNKIYVDDESYSKKLKWFNFLHKSEVIYER